MNNNQNNSCTSRNMSRATADTPQILPSFPDVEGGSAAYPDNDRPQTLPIFPDVEGGEPAYPDNDYPQTLPSFPSIEGGIPATPTPVPPTSSQPSIPSQRCCRVRFFHAAPQAGPVNVNVGFQRVASNLAFGNFSAYYCFNEGFWTVNVMNARTNRTNLLRTTISLNAGETLTFAIVNNASTGALELVRISDTVCSNALGNFACIRMANLLLGDTALDMLMQDGRVLFSDVRYKENTMSRRLRSGRYNFFIANTPSRIQPRIVDVEMDGGVYRVSDRYIPGYGELDLVTALSLQVCRGMMYTVYIIGQQNTDEIQVVVTENR